jgi:DNA repair exonuclease SbcCD nuclease subunit
VIRIAHVSDTHLGRRELPQYLTNDPDYPDRKVPVREIDLRAAFRACVDAAIAEGVDLFLHTGDLYDSPVPNFPSIFFAMQQFRRLSAAGIPSLIVAGNHCHPHRLDLGHALHLLQFVPLTTVVADRSEVISYPDLDLKVLAIPHVAVQDDALVAIEEPAAINLAAVHAAVAGDPRYAMNGDESHERLITLTDDLRWFDYVAFGHYHGFDPIRVSDGLRTFYAGSTERIVIRREFNDDPKGFVLIDLGPDARGNARAQVRHVAIATRPVIALEPVDGYELSVDNILDRLRLVTPPDGFRGCLVRVIVRNLSDETLYALTDRRIQDVFPDAYLVIDRHALGRDPLSADALPDYSHGAIEKELDRLIADATDSEADRDWLRRVGRKYLAGEVDDATALVDPA